MTKGGAGNTGAIRDGKYGRTAFSNKQFRSKMLQEPAGQNKMEWQNRMSMLYLTPNIKEKIRRRKCLHQSNFLVILMCQQTFKCSEVNNLYWRNYSSKLDAKQQYYGNNVKSKKIADKKQKCPCAFLLRFIFLRNA